MDNITVLEIAVDIIDSDCQLNHGLKDLEKHKAIDSLVIPLKKKDSEEEDCISIPVCESCRDGLFDPCWILLFCLDCLSSQWVSKELSKLDYTKKEGSQIVAEYDMILLRGCPKCSTKLQGIYYL